MKKTSMMRIFNESGKGYWMEGFGCIRDCSAGNRAYLNICSTLRAEMGDNRPAVCYSIDHVVTTGGGCTAQGPCWYENVCPTEKAGGVHAVCYEVNDG